MMVQSLVLVWNSAVQERFNINFSVNFFASDGGVLVWGGGGRSGHWAVGFGFVRGVGAGLWFYGILGFA